MKFQLPDIRRTTWLMLALALAACSAAQLPEQSAGAGVVRFTGLLDHPGTLRVSDLASHPQHQQRATFDSHDGLQSYVYQGVSLFGLLSEYGIQSEPQKFGGLLDRYWSRPARMATRRSSHWQKSQTRSDRKTV